MIEHLKNTYGLLPGVWSGITLTIAGTVFIRVIAPVLLAFFLTSAATGTAAWNYWLYGFLTCYIVGIAFHYIADYVFVSTTDKTYQKLVVRLFIQMHSLNVNFVRNTMGGTLNTIFRDHLDGTINVFRLFRTELIPLIITIILSSVVISIYDSSASYFFLTAVIVQAFFSVYAIKRTQPARNNTKRVYKQLSGVFNNYISNSTLLQVSGRLDWFVNKIRQLAIMESEFFWIRHKITFQFELIANILTALCFVGVIFSLRQAELSDEQYYQSTFIAALFCFQGMMLSERLGDLVQRLAEHWNNARSSLTSLEDNLQPIAKPLDEHSQKTFEKSSEIEFHKVKFGYPNTTTAEVFSNANLLVPTESHVIVRGLNGSGKSTLFNLILGIDTPISGDVRVGGHSLLELPKNLLYKRLSYMPQRSPTVAGTVHENITLFEDFYDSGKLTEILKLTGLQKIIDSGELNLNQQVGEGGSNISGGQAQRIAIARTLLRDTAIYLFDEPTSALPDNEAESLVDQLTQYLNGKTVIFITHTTSFEKYFSLRLSVGKGGLDLQHLDS